MTNLTIKQKSDLARAVYEHELYHLVFKSLNALKDGKNVLCLPQHVSQSDMVAKSLSTHFEKVGIPVRCDELMHYAQFDDIMEEFAKSDDKVLFLSCDYEPRLFTNIKNSGDDAKTIDGKLVVYLSQHFKRA